MDAFVEAFVAELLERGRFLERHGAQEAAAACRAVADDLEQEFAAWWSAELSIATASEESGYSADRLRELVRDGTIPGRPGQRGEVRVRRSELPKRPQRPKRPCSPVDQLARQIETSRQGHR